MIELYCLCIQLHAKYATMRSAKHQAFVCCYCDPPPASDTPNVIPFTPKLCSHGVRQLQQTFQNIQLA